MIPRPTIATGLLWWVWVAIETVVLGVLLTPVLALMGSGWIEAASVSLVCAGALVWSLQPRAWE